jgi:non-ribosomal peptide synthetase component F
VVVGTDLANRQTVETESLIGFFVNLIALRTSLAGDPTFRQLLARVREVTLGAYAHQDVPFDKLVEELRPERCLTHNPLVQVLFVMQNTPRAAARLPQLSVTPIKVSVPSKFDMAVFVRESDEGIAGTWLYNPDIFEPSTIRRMMMMYQSVLDQVLANPEIRLSALLGALSDVERKQLAQEHSEFQAVSQQRLQKIKRKATSQT